MRLTLRWPITLLVKLTLATLKLDDQPAQLLRQSSFLLWELLPERVAKYLDSRLLHARLTFCRVLSSYGTGYDDDATRIASSRSGTRPLWFKLMVLVSFVVAIAVGSCVAFLCK